MSSGRRSRRLRRALVAASTAVLVVTGAAGLVFAGPTAVAAVPEDDLGAGSTPSEPVTGTASSGGLTGLAGAAASRATTAALSLAMAATPDPPPREYCPVPAAEFVDSWGFARSGGRRHKGVDMMAPYGSPVFAPVSGTVRSSNSALGGLGFYLDGDDGNRYFGSHLATLTATGPVDAGDRVGTVGTSGNANSPHLHFEVAPGGGRATNPYPYARAWCDQDPDDPWSGVPRP